MFYELSEIRKIRKKLGLTQSELAKLARVSQSMLAKVEAGKLNPTYNTTVKVFNALEGMTRGGGLVARDVMSKRLISAGRDEHAKALITRMRQHGISQLPVMEHDRPVGLVTEASMLAILSEKPEQLSSLKASDIMEECPPILSTDTPLDLISHLLNFFPIVLVANKGRTVGIVAKADILAKMGSG